LPGGSMNGYLKKQKEEFGPRVPIIHVVLSGGYAWAKKNWETNRATRPYDT